MRFFLNGITGTHAIGWPVGYFLGEERGEGGVGFADCGFGVVPADAAVGDGNSVLEVCFGLGEGLVAGVEVALDHGADDGFVGEALAHDFFEDSGLTTGFLGAVGVVAVDHDGGFESGIEEGFAGFGDVLGGIVGAFGSASEYDVAVGVAFGGDGAGLSGVVDPEKGLFLAGGFDGVDGDGESAVGAVFEAEGHREAGCHLAVGLALGGAGANRGPTDEVGNVLRGDGVEEFGGGGDAEGDDFAEEAARLTEAFGDVAGAVEVGVHDEAFPANGGAGFFKINTHHDEEAVADFGSEGGDFTGVFASGFEVVDGTGTDHQEETGVVTKDDSMDRFAAFGDEAFVGLGTFDLGAERGGGRQEDLGGNIDVGDFFHRRG